MILSFCSDLYLGGTFVRFQGGVYPTHRIHACCIFTDILPLKSPIHVGTVNIQSSQGHPMGNHQKPGVKINSKKILLQFQRTPPGGVVDLSTSVATVTEGVGQEDFHHDITTPIFPERMQQCDEHVSFRNWWFVPHWSMPSSVDLKRNPLRVVIYPKCSTKQPLDFANFASGQLTYPIPAWCFSIGCIDSNPLNVT